MYLPVPCTCEFSLTFPLFWSVTKVRHERWCAAKVWTRHRRDLLCSELTFPTSSPPAKSGTLGFNDALGQIIWNGSLGDVIVTLVTKCMRGFRQLWQPETLVLKFVSDYVSQKAAPLRSGDSLDHQILTCSNQSLLLVSSQKNFPHQKCSLERPSSCGLRLSKCKERCVICTQDLDTVFLQVKTSPRL